jgi:hypothetical protein
LLQRKPEVQEIACVLVWLSRVQAGKGPVAVKSTRFVHILRRRMCKHPVTAAHRTQSLAVKAYLATTGALFALLAVLHVWRLVVERPGIRAEFWIVAGGSLLSAVLALWAMKLLFALKRSNRPPSAAE